MLMSHTMQLVPRKLDEEAQEAASERRAALNAALSLIFDPRNAQSELHRLLVEAGERRLSLQTVNKWCRGKAPMSEMTFRGVMTVLGLPATWRAGDPLPQGWVLPRPM